MRKLVCVALLVGTMIVVTSAATAAESRAQDGVIVSAGGTQASNGVWLPGAAICENNACQGVPVRIEQGANIQFINPDPDTLANGHQIVSYKTRKKTGQALFKSELLNGPDQTLMITSHLKPGIYPFTCSVHYKMDGLLEVVDS